MGSCLFRSDVHVNAISMPCTIHAGAVIGWTDLLGTITDPLCTCSLGIQCHTWIHRLLLDSYTQHIPYVHYLMTVEPVLHSVWKLSLCLCQEAKCLESSISIYMCIFAFAQLFLWRVLPKITFLQFISPWNKFMPKHVSKNWLTKSSIEHYNSNKAIIKFL